MAAVVSRKDKGQPRLRTVIARQLQQYRARARQEALATLDERMAAAGCRVLAGHEFVRRKAELEAMDRAARAKAEASV